MDNISSQSGTHVRTWLPWWECELLSFDFNIRHVLPGRSNHGRKDTPDVIYSREFITLSFLAECYDHGEKIVETSDVSYSSYLHFYHRDWDMAWFNRKQRFSLSSCPSFHSPIDVGGSTKASDNMMRINIMFVYFQFLFVYLFVFREWGRGNLFP